jgi:hypothetical protein
MRWRQTRYGLVFGKYDGGLHRESGMTLLGEDQYGTWLGASAGTIVHVGGRGTRSSPGTRASGWSRAARGGRRCSWRCPTSGTSTATSRRRHAGRARPEVALVDLDLDLYRIRGDQRVHLLDHDQFDAHRSRFGCPAEVVGATEAAADLRAASAGTSRYTTWRHRIPFDRPRRDGRTSRDRCSRALQVRGNAGVFVVLVMLACGVTARRPARAVRRTQR